MTKKLSLHLDLIRGLAAILVVFHHYNIHIFEGGYSVFPDVGQESVIVFFVLSGFVISFVLAEREKTAAEFITRRFARLWSVLLPALVVMLACNLGVKALNPSLKIEYLNPTHWPISIGMALGFLNYNTFVGDPHIPTGGTLWSLSCEFWYYMLAAIWVFMPRGLAKWVLLAFLTAFLGPRVMLLLPIWLLGVFLYHKSKTVRWSQSTALVVMAVSVVAIIACVASGIRYSYLHFPQSLEAKFGTAVYAPYYWLLSIPMALYLLGAISLGRSEGTISPRIDRVVRHVASISFFLYLTHLPFMFLLQWILKSAHIGEPFRYFIPCAVIVLCLLVGKPIEDSKKAYTGFIRRWVLGIGRVFGGRTAQLEAG